MRQRLELARVLLADKGAIFIQIGEDNLHRVRALVDETFGEGNVITTIVVKKKGAQKGGQRLRDFFL
jgi:adenine-specific DNA-methyltransferase